MFRSRALLIVVLFAQLFMGCLTGKGVLCIEPDGGVVFEAAGSSCCEATSEAPTLEAGEAVLVPGAGGDDCCACVDIPLPGDNEPGVVAGSAPPLDRLNGDASLPLATFRTPVVLEGAGVASPAPPARVPSRALASPLFLRC